MGSAAVEIIQLSFPHRSGSGTLTGFFAPIDNSNWLSLGSFSTATSGNDVDLVWTAAIPEARTVLLWSFGMLALLGCRSRDKSPGV
jgi:hypothetical protein